MTDEGCRFTIHNQGGGAAFDIRWGSQSKHEPEGHPSSQAFVLGAGASFQGVIDADQQATLFCYYVSTFGEEHRSEVSIHNGQFQTRYFPHP